MPNNLTLNAVIVAGCIALPTLAIVAGSVINLTRDEWGKKLGRCVAKDFVKNHLE